MDAEIITIEQEAIPMKPGILEQLDKLIEENKQTRSQIYFRGEEEREGNLWKVSLKDQSERPVTKLVGKRGTIGQMQPSLDGRFLYFPWQDDLADVWVMDVAP